MWLPLRREGAGKIGPVRQAFVNTSASIRCVPLETYCNFNQASPVHARHHGVPGAIDQTHPPTETQFVPAPMPGTVRRWVSHVMAEADF